MFNMKIKVLVSLLLTFILIFNISMSSFATHQAGAISVSDDDPFTRMGLNVIVGDDAPAIAPHEHVDIPFEYCEESGGAFFCGRDVIRLRMPSISRLSEHEDIIITDEDLDIILDFVADVMLNRNAPMHFDGSFIEALKEIGLFEIFFARIDEILNNEITPAPLNTHTVSVSLQHGRD